MSNGNCCDKCLIVDHDLGGSSYTCRNASCECHFTAQPEEGWERSEASFKELVVGPIVKQLEEKYRKEGYRAAILAVREGIPNDDELRKWQLELTDEASLEWFASGAIRMRITTKILLDHLQDNLEK